MMDKRTILVTGANGQLGTALRRVSGKFLDMDFLFTDVDTLDICDKSQVEDFFMQHLITDVVNCAAYTAVDQAESDGELCRRINCIAVQNIGEAALEHGAKVIHVSTDYVFDGKGTRPYREDDEPNPTSVYGRTKLEGERALQAVCPDAVIIRTAWLYSEVGKNFVKTMLRLGAERDEIGVVADQKGTPTYAGDLADAIGSILLSDVSCPGIYHFTDGGVCTWYDFAVKIFDIAGLQCKVNALTTEQYPTPVVRPAYSVLDKTKIKETYAVDIPQWEDSLVKCIDRLNS